MIHKKEPIWLQYKLIVSIHSNLISEHGGLSGIRDEDLLESALFKPKNLYSYTKPEPSLSNLAASYAYGLIKNHPFIDGNKRIALVASRLFLRINGTNLFATEEEKYITYLNLANGNLTEKELSIWLSKRTKLN